METLKIDLFAPGMGPLHRAGLGGLASTINSLKLTEGFSFDNRSVTLSWERPEGARDFFGGLYEAAFGLRDGLIRLPGALVNPPPTNEVLAELQQGLSQTILQFGPNRKSEGLKLESYVIDDVKISYQHQSLIGYTHRSAWGDLLTSKGTLRSSVTIAGTTAPGFVQRHVAIPSTSIEQSPGHAVALHFALVGTLSLAIDRKSSVLLIPDVDDLREYARIRPYLTPREIKECRIASAADAGLQAFLRLRGSKFVQRAAVKRCFAVVFTSQSWNEKQKTRASVLEIVPDEAGLDRFKAVLASRHLTPRLVKPTTPPKKGEDASQAFWVDSAVRALIAENVVRKRPWYFDFRRLVVGPDGKDDSTKVRNLGYEREGLIEMVDLPWEDKGEERLVRAIHDAMGWRFAMIAEDTKYDKKTGVNRDAYFNRRERQVMEWRLALAGAKTADDVRKVLTEIWSKSLFVPKHEQYASPRFNPVLRESWTQLLPIICDDRRWQLNRDLALLALASYGSSSKKNDEDSPNSKATDPGVGEENL